MAGDRTTAVVRFCTSTEADRAAAELTEVNGAAVTVRRLPIDTVFFICNLPAAADEKTVRAAIVDSSEFTAD